MNGAALPRDTTTLQAMVVAQQAEIEHLKLIIAKLRRMQFGHRHRQPLVCRSSALARSNRQSQA